MEQEKKGRPKASRKFKWFPKEGTTGLWMEDMNYDPKTPNAAPKWEDATKPPTGTEKGSGKPLPKGQTWGDPPDPNKFLRIWVKCSSIEEAYKQMWWCSPARLRRERSRISKYLEEKGFYPVKVLRSDKHMFGSTGAQAKNVMAKLAKENIIKRQPAAERRAEEEAKAKRAQERAAKAHPNT